MSSTERDLKLEMEQFGLTDLPVGGTEISTLADRIQEGAKRVKALEGKDVVLVIGNSKVGKSTLITYLMGADMKGVKGTGPSEPPFYVVSEKSDDKYPTIGRNLLASETMYPQGYVAQDGLTILCDYPGFLDSGSETDKIALSINRDAAIKSVKSIRVMVVISYPDIVSMQGEGILKLIEVLGDAFNNPTKIADSIMWVVTQTPTAPGSKDLVCDENGILNLLKGGFYKKIKRYTEYYAKNGVASALEFADMLSSFSSKDRQKTFVKLKKQLGPDALKTESQHRQLALLESLNPLNVLVANIFNNEDRSKILTTINKLKIVGREEFRFDRVDNAIPAFEKLSINIAEKASELFEEQLAVCQALQYETARLEKNKKLQEDLVIAAKNGDLSGFFSKIIEDNRQKIKDNEALIKVSEKIIKDSKTELFAYDNNDRTLLKTLSFNEPRAVFPFGLLGYSEKEFIYPEKNEPLIPILEVVKNDCDKTNGYFETWNLNHVAGRFYAKYFTYFGENANCKIDIYSTKRDKFSGKIIELKNKIKAQKEKIEAINILIQNLKFEIAKEEPKITEWFSAEQVSLTSEQQVIQEKINDAQERLKNIKATIEKIKPKFAAIYQTVRIVKLQDTTLLGVLRKAYNQFNTGVEKKERSETLTHDSSSSQTSVERTAIEVKGRAEIRQQKMVFSSHTTANTAAKRINQHLGWLQKGTQVSSSLRQNAGTTDALIPKI